MSEHTYPRRTLGTEGLEVSALGLGCMGMSAYYGPRDSEESLRTLNRAIDLGVTFWDTADAYGAGANEELLAQVLRTRRDEVTVATKFAIRGSGPNSTAATSVIDSSPEYAVQACDASLKRLGIETIDLYYMHRRTPEVPIEDTVGALAGLVEAGKIRHIGLSEVGADTLRRANGVHPITALQTEWSLWERAIEAEILPTARELGIGIVPYSPVGRGFLTGAFDSVDDLAEDDFRRGDPRFAGENFARNKALVDAVGVVAQEIGCTPVQLALAWLLAQGPDVAPIPGTKRVKYLEENAQAAQLVLTPAQLAAVDAAVPAEAVSGERYSERGMTLLGR